MIRKYRKLVSRFHKKGNWRFRIALHIRSVSSNNAGKSEREKEPNGCGVIVKSRRTFPRTRYQTMQKEEKKRELFDCVQHTREAICTRMHMSLITCAYTGYIPYTEKKKNRWLCPCSLEKNIAGATLTRSKTKTSAPPHINVTRDRRELWINQRIVIPRSLFPKSYLLSIRIVFL